jgi:predicted small integral membrane protein
MHQTAIDIAQAVLVALQAAWLSLGTYDNIRYPRINRDVVAKVLGLDALADTPEIYAMLAHRRVTSQRAVRALFALVVVAEVAVSAALWLAALALALAAAGLVGGDLAGTLAIGAVTGFTAIWAGFLIGGQWFCYWHGDYGQATHFFMTLWGIATLLALNI